MTINDIQAAVRAAGSHWFDPDTMRFFGTRVLPTVYEGPGGVYFVTSEQPPYGPRVYSVRRFDPSTAHIDTVGEFAEIKTREKAIRRATKLAAGEGRTKEVQVTEESHRPVTPFEQLFDDIVTHTGRQPGRECVTDLVKRSKLHHRYMEMLCSDEAFCRQLTPDGEHPRVVTLRRQIAKLAERMNCRVLFSGDPRGCTVKLVFPDGYTNDFAKEGYCVPTEL